MATRATTCSCCCRRAARASAGAARSSRPGCGASSRSGATSPRINGLLAQRRASIARSITSFRQLSEALGRSDTRLAEWVTAQNQALQGFANQSEALQESLREFPSTLQATQQGLQSSAQLSRVVGPASRALIPTAQSFAPAQVALQGFLNETVDPIRTQIRPFTRQVQRPVKHLKQASQPLAQTANSTAGALSDINRLFNAWAYNPPGSEEGYLFWTAWLNHNANGAALLQDAERAAAARRRPPVLPHRPARREPRGRAPVHQDAAAVHQRPAEQDHLPARPERHRRDQLHPSERRRE